MQWLCQIPCLDFPPFASGVCVLACHACHYHHDSVLPSEFTPYVSGLISVFFFFFSPFVCLLSCAGHDRSQPFPLPMKRLNLILWSVSPEIRSPTSLWTRGNVYRFSHFPFHSFSHVSSHLTPELLASPRSRNERSTSAWLFVSS